MVVAAVAADDCMRLADETDEMKRLMNMQRLGGDGEVGGCAQQQHEQNYKQGKAHTF